MNFWTTFKIVIKWKTTFGHIRIANFCEWTHLLRLKRQTLRIKHWECGNKFSLTTVIRISQYFEGTVYQDLHLWTFFFLSWWFFIHALKFILFLCFYFFYKCITRLTCFFFFLFCYTSLVYIFVLSFSKIFQISIVWSVLKRMTSLIQKS